MPKATVRFWPGVILASIVIGLNITGCKKSEPESSASRYQLPERIEHPKPGFCRYLTPRALVDSLNRGAKLDVYYLDDPLVRDSSLLVPIPGMKTVMLGMFLSLVDTVRSPNPLVLICMFGDDSRKLAQTTANRGFNTYYVDGGFYRLSREIHKNDWKLLPRYP